MQKTSPVRQRLQAQKDELADRLARIRLDRSHAKGVEPDWDDRAIEKENDEVLERLESATELDLFQVQHALARHEAGHYGICETCRGRIEPARLRAMPHATTCQGCAAEHARAA